MALDSFVHDRDTQFTASVDAVFAAEGARTIGTPSKAPRAKLGQVDEDAVEAVVAVDEGEVETAALPDETRQGQGRPLGDVLDEVAHPGVF